MANAEINTLTPDRCISPFCLFTISLEQFGWFRVERYRDPDRMRLRRNALHFRDSFEIFSL